MSDEMKISELIQSKLGKFKGFSRLASSPKIKFAKDEKTVTVGIDIIVFFGVNIPQLCYDIQSKLKRHIERSTEYDVKSVDINVEGIDKPL